MRRGIVLVAVLASLIAATGVSATSVDRGLDRPPTHYNDDEKALWMTEWAACWRVKMTLISHALHIPVTSSMSPQAAAQKLSKRAVKFLYETKPELATAAQGCRNGILWRYYHPPPG